MRALAESRERWQHLLKFRSLLELRQEVTNGDREALTAQGLRSVCWKIFLLFESLDTSTWRTTLSQSREAYTSLHDHFLRYIEHPDKIGSLGDPLNDDEKSPWKELRDDEALRTEILQDVDRCMPENLYFRQPATQKMLLDILSIYCKLNRDVGYRQGMHELLAPVLWVIERDALDRTSIDFEGNSEDKLLLDTLDSTYIEHDAFTLFSLIMQTAKSFYETGVKVPTAQAGPTEESPIVVRSRRIHEEYLAKLDPQLSHHLKEIDILPQVFLIRWIRLLFGREFEFDDVLGLWDALFAEDAALDLVDLICVSMLLRIRWQLLESDYSTALSILLRYPPTSPYEPRSFVQDAIGLRDDLTSSGGAKLILRYSGKAPAEASEPRSRPTRRPISGVTRSPLAHSPLRQGSSPGISPVRLFQQRGGIEGLLQDTAKRVYKRGEKWGVNKAVREAVEEVRKNVQNLQAGKTAGRPSQYTHWSLDKGRNVNFDTSELTRRVQALEERNKALAKMLEDAMENLWAQQKVVTSQKGQDDSSAEAFSLAIAKVQFVQVYLEDSTLPLPDSEELEEPLNPKDKAEKGSLIDRKQEQSSLASPKAAPNSTSPARRPDFDPLASSPIPTQLDGFSASGSPDPLISTSPSRPGVSQFHRPRSSLANSSFAWMLGEDEQRSEFVSSSSPRSDKRNRSSRNSFLFGEAPDMPDITRRNSSNVKSEDADEESFTLGTLKGSRKKGE